MLCEKKSMSLGIFTFYSPPKFLMPSSVGTKPFKVVIDILALSLDNVFLFTDKLLSSALSSERQGECLTTFASTNN